MSAPGEDRGAPLTLTAAAARVRRSKRTLEYWIGSGPEEKRLPVIRVGNVRYVYLDDLLDKYRQVLQAPKGGKGHARPKRT